MLRRTLLTAGLASLAAVHLLPASAAEAALRLEWGTVKFTADHVKNFEMKWPAQ
jgi:hypothetical protein